MMLYLGPGRRTAVAGRLAVVHVTLHTALRNVFGQLTEEAILAKARLADRFMSRLMPTRRAADVPPVQRHAGPSAAKKRPLRRGRGSASAR